MKSRKGLEAYNQFYSGWASTVNLRDLPSIMRASVLNSQRLNEKSLQPWIAANSEGLVLCAHCNCIAGYVLFNCLELIFIFLVNFFLNLGLFN